MTFKDQYPDFATIEEHIRRARAERAVWIASWLSGVILAAGRGLKRLATNVGKFMVATGNGLAAERERRAIEADTFLQRSVPRY